MFSKCIALPGDMAKQYLPSSHSGMCLMSWPREPSVVCLPYTLSSIQSKPVGWDLKMAAEQDERSLAI